MPKFLTPVELAGVTADPGSIDNGDTWYRSDVGRPYTRVAGNTYALGTQLIARSAADQVISATTITALTNLSVPVVAGTYSMTIWIGVSHTSGSSTNVGFTLSPSGGPAVTWMLYSWTRYATTTGLASTPSEAFNIISSGTSASVTTAKGVLSGSFTASGSGTISVSATRTGVGSDTFLAGSFILLNRIG